MGFGDGFYKQVPDNIVLDTSSPLFDNIVDNNVNLYVSTTGDDTNGDGSLSNPYATPQRAVDSIPNDIPNETIVVVNCGSGEFYFPDVSRVSENIYLNIIGDRSSPIISLAAGEATFSQIGGQQAVRTANVGSYSPNITEGDYWLFRDTSIFSTAIFGLGYALIESSSPNLNVVTRINVGSAPLFVYPYATTFLLTRLTTKTTSSSSKVRTLESYRGVRFFGIKISAPADSSNDGIEGANLQACAFVGNGSFTNYTLDSCTLQGLYCPPAVAYMTFSDCFHRSSLIRRSATCIKNNLFYNGIITTIATQDISNVSLMISGRINFEGTGACLNAGRNTNVAFSVGDIFVENTKSSFIADPYDQCLSSFIFNATTVSGSVTGNAVKLSNGSQAFNIKAACNGTLTAGGSEIIIGGNSSGQTFASLPATDIGASAPQFCRAS